jgi:hypothetical protein
MSFSCGTIGTLRIPAFDFGPLRTELFPTKETALVMLIKLWTGRTNRFKK